MAKIRKGVFSYRVNGDQKIVELTIEYNNVFYVLLPDTLVPAAEKIQWTDKANELNLEWVYGRGKKLKGIAIKGKTENELLSNIPTSLRALSEMGEVVREVIIVYFEGYNDTHNFSPPIVEKDFKMAKFGYKFAKESEDSLAGNKHYFTETEISGSTKRKKLYNMTNTRHVIIPDTPENRDKVEYLYKAMEKISDRMSDLCKDGDKIQELDVVKLLT